MKRIAIFLIKIYQKIFSPDKGVFSLLFLTKTCPYIPTCSEYAIQAINKYGFFCGSYKSFIRLIKCNPWTKGGYDPLK